MSNSRTRGLAVFLMAACWLLPPATAFVGLALSGVGAIGSAHWHRHVHSVRRHDVLFGEADLPGAGDARLAGWRVASPVADSPVAAADDMGSAPSKASDPESGEPGCGDVVEYPLSDLVKKDSDDGREKGVAVIVSINKHRNDAWKLPEDILDKAELQVLCPDLDGGEEGVWMADELEACAFAKLGEMKVLKSEFNGALDKWKRWTIDGELSEGCGARDAEWEYDML